MANDEASMFQGFPFQQLVGVTIGNQGSATMNLQCSEALPLQQWVKYLKIWLKHQISYNHPLTYWLLIATIGNQRSPMMNLQWSEVFLLQHHVKHLKIWLNYQIPYYHPLSYLLAGATTGNHRWPMMNLQCSEAFPHQQWVKHLKIWLKHQTFYFDWQPFLTIQDGCHIGDPIWLPMLPATFIAVWRFLNFLSFPMFSLVHPTLHLTVHVNYHVW